MLKRSILFPVQVLNCCILTNVLNAAILLICIAQVLLVVVELNPLHVSTGPALFSYQTDASLLGMVETSSPLVDAMTNINAHELYRGSTVMRVRHQLADLCDLVDDVILPSIIWLG